jgi:hypothetical protein
MMASVDELALRQNAATGATLLDEHVPGWQWKINLHSLDVSDPARCIGGQVGWETTKSILDHHKALMSDVGMFRLNGDLWDDETYVIEYGILQDQWTCEITRRRDGKSE